MEQSRIEGKNGAAFEKAYLQPLKTLPPTCPASKCLGPRVNYNTIMMDPPMYVCKKGWC